MAQYAAYFTMGDKDVVLNIDAGGFNMAGSVPTLILSPGEVGSEGPATQTAPLTITNNGLSCTYALTGKDFLIGGPWLLRLRINDANGDEIFTSPPTPVFVYALPTIAA